ncbi:MAG: energy-coupling factor transporter transmembrane protein EcfT [Clostridia bacterium]|nr:energy-coupling factor transporter transmembrane protein EcfT [Clostridia bacterium]
MRDAFDTVNPIVAFVFFAFALIMPMLVMHPVLLGISLVCALIWLFMLRGRKAIGYILKFVLPIMLLTAILNPLFNHAGITTLFYLRHNPVTLESIVYGASSAAMLASVVLWFACFNQIFTSDKIVYLLGRFAPSISLVVSMALRFVPLFSRQAKRISYAQRGAGMGTGGGSVIKRARSGLSILSSLITWGLETSVTTADSMRARGYGLHPRRSFANYRFDGRDALIGGLLALGMLCSALASGFKLISIRFFPSFKINEVTPLFIAFCAIYAITLLIPVIMNSIEAYRWHLSRSKL